MIPCCWTLCNRWATTQATIPGPLTLGGRAAIWLCAAHEREWMRLRFTGFMWGSFNFGLPTIIGGIRTT